MKFSCPRAPFGAWTARWSGHMLSQPHLGPIRPLIYVSPSVPNALVVTQSVRPRTARSKTMDLLSLTCQITRG